MGVDTNNPQFRKTTVVETTDGKWLDEWGSVWSNPRNAITAIDNRARAVSGRLPSEEVVYIRTWLTRTPEGSQAVSDAMGGDE